MAKILAGGLPGGCVGGRADILAHLEFRPGKEKMCHPGTFNANPLSAAAGITTLQIVADGEANRRANATGQQLRQRLNAMFAAYQNKLGAYGEFSSFTWAAYGEFSGFRLLPNYQGQQPTGDDFIPYDGALDKLEGARNARLSHAFRQGMLLHGVDLPGLSGMTTAAHTETDVELTVAAVAGTLDLLRDEGLI